MKKRKWLILPIVLIYLFTVPVAASFSNLRGFDSSDSFSPAQFVKIQFDSLKTHIRTGDVAYDDLVKIYDVDFDDLYQKQPDEFIESISPSFAEFNGYYGFRSDMEYGIFHDEFRISNSVFPQSRGVAAGAINIRSMMVDGKEVDVNNVYIINNDLIMYDTEQGFIFAFYTIPLGDYPKYEDYEEIQKDQLEWFKKHGQIIYVNEEQFLLSMEEEVWEHEHNGDGCLVCDRPTFTAPKNIDQSINVELRYRLLSQKQRCIIGIVIWTVVYFGLIIGACQIYKHKRRSALPADPGTEEAPKSDTE